MRLRLRLSLLARMAVSLAVLLSISLVIAALLATVGGAIGVALLGGLYRVAEALAGLPQVSAIVPVPPLLVAGIAALSIYAAIHGWPYVRARTDEEYLLPPTTPLSAGITLWIFGCLYLVIVETGAALLAGLSTLAGVAVVVGLGVVLAFAVTVGEVRRRVAELRASVVAGSTPIGDATPGGSRRRRGGSPSWPTSPHPRSASSRPIGPSRSPWEPARMPSWSCPRASWRP